MIHDVVLYSSNADNFTNEGLGVLIDFVEDVEVTENDGGFFELKFTYSLNGRLAESIQEEAYIKTVANERQDDPLIFRIYECEPDYIDKVIYVRARLKIIDDMMNAIHPAITFKTGDIMSLVQGVFNSATPKLDYRLAGSIANEYELEQEDGTVFTLLYGDKGLFTMNNVTPLFTPLGLTLSKTRGNNKVDTITEQDFINRFTITKNRGDMVTAIIPWTVTKKDELVESGDKSTRETVEERVYGYVVLSPKIQSHQYPFVARFIEYRNDVTREWEEDNRTFHEYKYQSVEDLNQEASKFFDENLGIDDYSVEASIETLGLHMDHLRRLSSLGLYDEVEFYLEEYQLKIFLKVSEVTYSPSLDMNLALKFKSTTTPLAKAGQKVNGNAPTRATFQAMLDKKAIENQLKNYITKDDGTNVYWVTELPPVEGAVEGDTVFLETAEGISIWVFENGAWVEKLPLDFEKRLNEYIKSIEQQVEDLLAEQEALRAESERQAKEFQDRIDNIDFSIPDEDIEAISEDIKQSIGFNKTDFDALKDEFETVRDTTKINAEMIGNDGVTRYSKNIVAGDTDREIEFKDGYLTIQANDGGFIEGQTYTISFEAICELMGMVTIDYDFSKETVLPFELILTPTDHRLPVVKTQERQIKLYPDTYKVAFKSDFYRDQTLNGQDYSQDGGSTVTLIAPQWVDGDKYQFVWAEEPTIIFDGGGA